MKRRNADIVKLVGDLVEENERLDASLEAVFQTVSTLAKPGTKKRAKKVFGRDRATIDTMKMLKGSKRRKSSATVNAGRRAALEKARAALAAKREAAKRGNTQKLGA